jgi:hypothetical protein
MHTHSCSYCRRDFVCSSPIECYDREPVTCRDCYLKHELAPFVISILVGVTLTTILIYVFGFDSAHN